MTKRSQCSFKSSRGLTNASPWIIHEPMEKCCICGVSIPHLLSQFPQGCEDFHFLLHVHVLRQFPHHDISVHLRRMSHSSGTIFRPSNAQLNTQLWPSGWVNSTAVCVNKNKNHILNIAVQTSASLVLSCPGCFLAKSRITSGVLNAWLMAAWIAWWWQRHQNLKSLFIPDHLKLLFL